jgi:hypothetical protein
MGCHVMFQNNYPANPHIHAWDPRINRHEGVDLESPNLIRDKVIVSVDWHKMLNYNATIQHFLKINSRMDNKRIFSTPMNTVDNNTVETLLELHRSLGSTKVDNANEPNQPSDDAILNPMNNTINTRENLLTQANIGELTANTDSSENNAAVEEAESESSLVPENLLTQTIVDEKEKKLYEVDRSLCISVLRAMTNTLNKNKYTTNTKRGMQQNEEDFIGHVVELIVEDQKK